MLLFLLQSLVLNDQKPVQYVTYNSTNKDYDCIDEEPNE